LSSGGVPVPSAMMSSLGRGLRAGARRKLPQAWALSRFGDAFF
jgi:hypothetical protein